MHGYLSDHRNLYIIVRYAGGRCFIAPSRGKAAGAMGPAVLPVVVCRVVKLVQLPSKVIYYLVALQYEGILIFFFRFLN